MRSRKDYFADGVTESLTTDLSRIAGDPSWQFWTIGRGLRAGAARPRRCGRPVCPESIRSTAEDAMLEATVA